ncbi:MAG TPA: hypothetical protein VGS22_07865 [Thermoanaerobaculia bacterium]|jgi:hypothetical protein|nr:hypothetical protein [Thermoanaerobaculia bacterium]
MVRIRLSSPAALALALTAAPLIATLAPRESDVPGNSNEDDLITGNSLPGESKAA